ncbi:MAG: ABC transporter permease [Chloroflexi bacterium RBG_13_53_26]|nr:MAG: ABC transporter permease [Chloroflexi bacterium RBG_13_53_26]
MNPSYRSLRVWQRNRDVFFKLWRSEVPGFFAEPILILLAMGFGLGTYVALDEGQRYIEFIAPGIIAAYAMFSASFECTYGSFIRMKYQKTYDSIIATPLSIDDVSAGEIFWGTTRSILTACVILVIIAAFGLVESPWALLVIPLAALAGLMFSSIALFFTSVVPAIYSFNYYYTLFITPMFFLGDVFFPVDTLPPVLQHIAWIAPLTPVANLMRSVVTGSPGEGAWWGLGVIAGYIAVFFPLSLLMMKRRLLR